MKITIKITKEVLLRSANCPMTCDDDVIMDKVKENCAVAVAIRDLFPKAKVFQSAINLLGDSWQPGLIICGDPNHGKRIDVVALPGGATSFIKKFDDSTQSERLKLKPIDFDIEVSDKFIQRYIGINEATEIINKSESMSV
jgi:hypothetical protein